MCETCLEHSSNGKKIEWVCEKCGHFLRENDCGFWQKKDTENGPILFAVCPCGTKMRHVKEGEDLNWLEELRNKAVQKRKRKERKERKEIQEALDSLLAFLLFTEKEFAGSGPEALKDFYKIKEWMKGR